VAAGVDREPQLGADTVGAGDEHRATVAGRHVDQGAETADAGEHLGRCARRTSGLMRSTSSSPASMSTPASR
jgi:hypothetical protein